MQGLESSAGYEYKLEAQETRAERLTKRDSTQAADGNGRRVASRMRRFLQTLVSSYLSLIASSVYTMVSVPLALHYLSRAEFGLWALMSQVGGYLMLVDLGMTSSTARFLIDHKDTPGDGEYGSVLQTGQLVLCVQGLIVVAAGGLLSPLLAQLLGIPPALRHSFIVLVWCQSALLAATMATKTLNLLLFAHQRLDVVNYAQPLGFAVMTVVLWVALRWGAAVYSVMWANAAGWLVGNVVLVVACLKLRLFPPHGAWGCVSLARFKQLFGFGRDMFLIALGEQLISASQTILISRGLGLEMVAVWSVGTKTFAMAWLVTRRVLDMSVPPLAEMQVRKESTQLRERFKAITVVSTLIGSLGAALLAACNTPFVTVWTHGQITWSTGKDVLLGAWLIVLAQRHCHANLVGVSKDVRFMRFIFLVEGLVFVVLGSLAERWAGLAGLIGTSVACTIGISGLYGVRRSSGYFGVPLSVVAWDWLKPVRRALLALAPLTAAVCWLSEPLTDWARVLVRGILLGGVGACVLLRYGLPPELKQELARRLPRGVGLWVCRVAGGTWV
ncbi:MAG TPA: lipopolysaccharide biosynthesis protein [Verrucomicrobiae bacterium]|nr:lipopolysaccharide biosynthesis protein [Verrucomicrobiae bacterium]